MKKRYRSELKDAKSFERLVEILRTPELSLYIEQRYTERYKVKKLYERYYLTHKIEHTVQGLINQALSFLEYKDFSTESAKFLHKSILGLPRAYVCVAFCNQRGTSSYLGSKYCALTEDAFKRIKYKMQKYGKYIIYYHNNRKQIDKLLAEKLVVRNTKKKQKLSIFRELLLNPFVTSEDIGKKYGISGSTVRRYVLVSCKILMKTSIKDTIIKPFKEIVFGKIKQTEILDHKEIAIKK